MRHNLPEGYSFRSNSVPSRKALFGNEVQTTLYIPLELEPYDWCPFVFSLFLQLKLVCAPHSFFSQASGNTGHIPEVDNAFCFKFFLWQIPSSLIILIMTRDADDSHSHLFCSDNSTKLPVNYLPEIFLEITTGPSSWTCCSYSFDFH